VTTDGAIVAKEATMLHPKTLCDQVMKAAAKQRSEGISYEALLEGIF